MEQKIYDLNEYSLEVKDGKAVVERKFKPGDAEDMVLRKSFGDGDVLVVQYVSQKNLLLVGE